MGEQGAWYYLTAPDYTPRERFGLAGCEVAATLLGLLHRALDRLGDLEAKLHQWALDDDV